MVVDDVDITEEFVPVKPFQTQRKIAHLIKEAAECGIFTCFSRAEFLTVFEHSPLHYIFMPMIFVAFTADAFFEIKSYRLNPNKDFTAKINLVTAITAAVLVDTVVLANLILGSFAAGPYLFLGVLTAMFIRHVVQLVDNIKKYRESKTPEVKKSFAQAAAFNVVSMLGIALGTIFVVGVMISPVGPLFALGIGIAVVSFTVGVAGWKLIPHSCRQKVKAGSDFFKKPSYQRIKEATEMRSSPQQPSQ